MKRSNDRIPRTDSGASGTRFVPGQVRACRISPSVGRARLSPPGISKALSLSRRCETIFRGTHPGRFSLWSASTLIQRPLGAALTFSPVTAETGIDFKGVTTYASNGWERVCCWNDHGDAARNRVDRAGPNPRHRSRISVERRVRHRLGQQHQRQHQLERDRRINNQAVVITKNTYEDVYGTGLHLRFGGGYMLNDESEVTGHLHVPVARRRSDADGRYRRRRSSTGNTPTIRPSGSTSAFGGTWACRRASARTAKARSGSGSSTRPT